MTDWELMSPFWRGFWRAAQAFIVTSALYWVPWFAGWGFSARLCLVLSIFIVISEMRR